MSEVEETLKKLFQGKDHYWSHPNSSFSDKGTRPPEDELKDILDPAVQIFSVIVATSLKNFTLSVWDDPKLFKKTKVTSDSILSQATAKDYYKDSDKTNKKREKEVFKRFKLKPKDDGYWKKFDLIVAEGFKKAQEEKYPEVLEEHTGYYIAENLKSLDEKLEIIREEDYDKESELIAYFLKKNPAVKAKIHKEITSKQKSFAYERIYRHQLPTNLGNHLPNDGFSTQQVYVYKKGNDLKIGVGSSRGSGTRDSHGYFGHLFAEAQNRGKSVSTFLIHFNSRLDMTIKLKPELVLSAPHDLTSNYYINRALSEKILKNIKKVYNSDLKD